MRALITGAAGFIGSHLADALVRDDHQVVGVDCLTPYYDIAEKRRNLDALLGDPRFTFHEADLASMAIEPLLEDVDVVFHQAGQPGVRLSWDKDFAIYVAHNVLVTQRLLEAIKRQPVRRLVYASSSSVYGNAPRYPTPETELPRPHSPYGVTKLAAEHLALLYADNWGLSVAALRYFTVYGPRQRPDMAIRRFIDAALDADKVVIYGDGEQVRDFTYVGDAVRANVLAASVDVAPAGPINVAGGGSTTVNALLALIEEESGLPIDRRHEPAQPGDVRCTGGSVELAERAIGWRPEVDLRTGVAAQIEWSREQRST